MPTEIEPAMNARDWIATRREIEQSATDGPWMSEWDTSDEWWTIHGQPNPTKGDDRMVCPEVATLQHSEDWTADVDFITDTRTSLPLALDALDAVLDVHQPVDALDVARRPGQQLTQVCTGCGTDDGNWQRWPCPTVRAIEEALS